MNRGKKLTFTLAMAGAAGFALAAAAGIASAQDSASSGAPNFSGSVRTFTLNGMTTAEVLSYSAPRELRVCNHTGRTSSPRDMRTAMPYAPTPLANRPVPMTSDSATPVPLEITYSGMMEEIQPGECFRAHVRRLRIVAVEPLPNGQSLNGTIGWLAPYGPPQSAAASEESIHEMIEQMRQQLRQDDRIMRAATAELRQARRDFVVTARDLSKTSAEANAEGVRPTHQASAATSTSTAR